MIARILFTLNLFLQILVFHHVSSEENSKPDTYFVENNWYRYNYTSTVDSSFLGTTPSKSGFQFYCYIRLGVFTNFRSVLRVEDCFVLNRIEQTDGDGGLEKDPYIKSDQASRDFSSNVSRYPLYFTFDNNKIDTNSIQIHKDETVYSVNIKRTILSTLQLELLSPKEKHRTIKQENVFGLCPVHFYIYDHSPNSVFSSYDLTLCKMPQTFTLQMRLFSIIKKIHGGYRQTETLEPIYPFRSTVDCQYNIAEGKIKAVECLQRQSFKLAENNASNTTAVTDIRQSFKEFGMYPVSEREDIKISSDFKEASFLFEFPKEENTIIPQKMVQDQLHTLVKSYTDLDLGSWPELYQDFVWFMKHSTEESLQLTIKDILDCHGNQSESCDKDKKMLEVEYFVDGLLSCATDACITVFTKCVKEEHVSWLTSRYFLYDLALNHEPTEESVLLVLDICKKSETASCWLPLSVMVNKFYVSSDNVDDVREKDGAIYKTISTLSDKLEKALKQTDGVDTEVVVRILKALHNIGTSIQEVYDTDGRLTNIILNLTSSQVNHKIIKSAIQVFENMKVTTIIRDKLVSIISDINQPSVPRTTAFSVLFMSADNDSIQKIINLIHTEQMDYMKTYMISYVEGLLENDQPDKKWFRTAWQKALKEDGRPLPEIDDYLSGRSRYMELSRYFRLPFSVTHYGLQFEFDLVYDPASPLIQSAVFRINYYKDGKYNLLEVSADIRGLEEFLDGLFGSKGKGLYSFLSMFAKARRDIEKGVNPQFADFDKKLSEALNKIIKIVNYPQFVLPDGILTLKLYGYEVMYVDINDILAMLLGHSSGKSKHPQQQQHQSVPSKQQQQQRQQSKGFISNIIMMIARGYRLIKTRSAKVLDLTKVMPTLSGAPLNMTVLLTVSMGLDVTAKADLSQYMKGSEPVQANAEISTGFAGEFFGQMVVKLGDIAKAGCRMLTSMNVKANLDSSATLTKGSKSSITFANYTAHFKRKNIEGQYDMAKIRSNLYHLHDDWVKVPVDVSVQKTVKKCTGSLMMLITGNTACVEVSYPDVTDSVTHAYFPLSGPFSADFVLTRTDKDMKEFNLEVNYLITNDTGRPKRQVNLSYSAPGKKLQRKVKINMEQSLTSHNIVTNIDMPEMGLHLNFVNKDLSNVDSTGKEIRSDYIRDVHLQMKTLTLFRAMMQIQRNVTEETVFDPKEGKDQTGNKTEMKTTLVLAAPNIGLDINFKNLREKLDSHISTRFHLKYYCSKHRPIMYLIHFQPKLAAANKDISEIEIVNDAMMGYKKGGLKLWSAEDSLHITYPGQKFSFSNDMLANDTHAHRKTVIKYIGSENKEETIEMNAHVENQTDQSNSHYCYHMTLEHKDRYDIHLKGHLHGNIKKRLTLNTDIDFKRKTPLKENGDVPLSKDLTITKDTDVRECSIFKLNEWKMKVNLTVNAKPVFVSGQRRPKGVEFVWDVDVLYPNCEAGGKIKSVGAIGSHLRNVFRDFRYWFRIKNSFMSIEPRIYDVSFNIGYLKRHFFDYHLTYSGPGIKASYKIHSDRYLNNTGFIIVKCHLESVWKLINFDYSENYTIIYKGSGLELTGVNHTLDATWAFFDLKLDSSLKNESGLFINQNGYIDVRYPMLSGITNISTQVTLSRTSRSGINIKLTRNGMEYFMDIIVKGPMAIDTSFFLKKPDGPKVFVVSLLSELVGSTSRESTIQWNPAFTKKGLALLKAKKNKLSLALSTASETLTKNLERSVISMVIPFTNKTLGYVVSKVAVPVMHYLPLPSSMKKAVASKLQQKSDENIKNSAINGNGTKQNIQHDDKRVFYLGEKMFGLVTKLESKVLALMSKMLSDPPLVVKNMIKKYIKPNLYQAMKGNKISFVEPLLMKWKHFLTYPRFTIGQKYILGRVKDRPKSEDNSVQTALLYDKSEILTFDGKLYQIKGSTTCPYLLLADVKHGDFAVIYTTEGITVITKTSMASIQKGGQVFIDGCNKPVNLPYKTDEMHAIKKNVSRVIHLDYGLTVSCDINIDHCNFGLTNHENQTIGLLGNNDGEIGNDFKSPDGVINLNIKKLLSDYELGDSQSCLPPVANRLSEVRACEDLQQKCQDFFTSLQSPLAKCFTKVDSLSFSNSCKERVKNCMPTSICPSVHAYISKCDIAGVTIEPSIQLDICKDNYPRSDEILPKALLDIIIVLYKEDSSDFCLPCIETFVRFLQTCDKTDVKLTFIQFDSQQTQLNEVLTRSIQHQFRLHTQKVVTVIKSDQDLSEPEYNTLKDLYAKNNIVLNVISRYKILKYKGLVGLDWDHRIISIGSMLDGTRELPQDFIIKLMAQTKGALFNPMLLEKNRKTRMEGLVKHICERQAYTNTNCKAKEDNSEKIIFKL